MHSRRYAAAFLLLIGAFSATATFIPREIAHAEGATSGKECPAEKKNEQEYNPSKPWNKKWTEKRGGNTVTILNLFGKTCKDTTNGKTVTGHCLREDRCKADETAEGEKPQQANCATINKDDPGCQAGAGGAGSENNEDTNIPDEPKPDNSDGVLPLPDEQQPKPEPKPYNPWTDGAAPINANDPTAPVGDLPKTPEPSGLLNTIENYFKTPSAIGPDTPGIGNTWGGQGLAPQQGGDGQSLYEQAFNNNSNSTGFSEPTSQSQSQSAPEQTWGELAGEYLGKAADYMASAYNTVSDALAKEFGGGANATESGVPLAEDTPTDATDNGGEPMKQLSPEEVKQIEDQQLNDRLAQADRETDAYDKALKDAENKVPVPDQVETDPQKVIEEQNKADEEFERKAREDYDYEPPGPETKPLDPETVEKIQRLDALKEDQGNKQYDFEKQLQTAKDAEAKLNDLKEKFDERWAPYRQCGMDGCSNQDAVYDVRDKAEQAEFKRMQQEVADQAKVTNNEYALAQDRLDEYKLADRQIQTLLDDKEVGDFLTERENEIATQVAKYEAEQNAYDKSDKAREMAAALQEKMNRDTAQIGNGYGLSKDCWGICNTVTYNDAFGNERTVPLTEYNRDNNNLLQALKSDGDLQRARADFFAGDDPLAAQTAKTIADGDYRGYLAERTLDKMLVEQGKADAVRNNDYYHDSESVQREADRREQLERLTSGGELTQLEQDALRKSDPYKLTEAEWNEERRLDRLGNGTIRAINDALRLSGPESKLTGSEMQSRLNMSEGEVFQQQKNAWGEAGLRAGLDVANLALLSTGAAGITSSLEASLLASREVAISSLASEATAARSFFAEGATGREAFMENQIALREATVANMERELGTQGSRVTEGQIAAQRAEIASFESKLADMRGYVAPTTEITAATEARLASEATNIGEGAVTARTSTAATEAAAGETVAGRAGAAEVIAGERVGASELAVAPRTESAAGELVGSEAANAPRALVTANTTGEAGTAIARASEAGAISRVGVADVAGDTYLYEVNQAGEVVLSPARDIATEGLAPASAKELNAIADTKGISTVADQPTVLRPLSGEVLPTERNAIDAYRRAAGDVEAWRASPVGSSPSSRLAQAEKDLEGLGLQTAIDGSVYRANGEVLGRLETADAGYVNAARPTAAVPEYIKAGEQWFEAGNLGKPIQNSEIIKALETKLEAQSIPAAQIAADVSQAKTIAAIEAREAQAIASQRAAAERAARDAAERAAEKLPPAVQPRSAPLAPARNAPRAPESQEVKDSLARLQKQGDMQALADKSRVLTGPTSQSIRDGIEALKSAGSLPQDLKFANAYLENAVYRVSSEGNLTRVSDAEVATAVKSPTNPTIRTSEAESIAREAKNIATSREAEEALQAKIVAARNYQGEIMVATDVREAGRALAGDVDAIAQQAARDATTFAWAPEAQLPVTLAEATGGKSLLTEAEQALANPFKLSNTEFSRGANASSDGLSPALQPYRAPQSTIADRVQTAVQDRLGAAASPETLAQRAGLDFAHPLPAPKTIVADLAPGVGDVPLVSIKPPVGVQVGDALSLPEAQAIRSFNSSLANYTKAFESGNDLARAEAQVSTAYSELAEVGITQRATDGALTRESGETVAVRVSPPMAAQATYAVVVAVDSQVREFATGATDETFSFNPPDLRILSSDFGVQPPINVSEAITLKKANDVLETTRSRDSLEYIFDGSGLEVRPEDGFIVRSNNGEVVARPADGGTQPGSLPSAYVPAGPTPPLPVKLVRKESVALPGGKTREIFNGLDYRGRNVVAVEVEISGAVATITGIEANRPGATNWTQLTNAVGPSAIRSLLNQFKAQHPEVVAIGGVRMSGARYAGKWDPEDLGEPMEILLPSIPAEPVPVRVTGNGPAAIALGIALSVASPLPMDAISYAIGGANNVFSLAAEAVQQPTPRDLERHAKALADIGKVQKGIASWYSTGSNGGTNPSDLTASGAWHRNDVYTVAMLGQSTKYAWGTRLLVKNVQEFLKDGSRNPNFGKEVEVVVTSTGSQTNRSLDLSPAARDSVGIGDDGTALVEYSVVSVPDIYDSLYKKGRTDLNDGAPVPKGTFDTKVAALKQNPQIAIAAAKTLRGQPTVVNNPGNGTAPTRSITIKPQTSIPEALTKILGSIIKSTKTPDDKAVDVIAALEKVNPTMPAIDKAVRLSREGYGNTDIYKNQRDLAARQLNGTDVASDADIASADAAIAKTLANIKANQSTADMLASRGLVAKGSTALKNADGSYRITTPSGTTFKLAQVAPPSTQSVTLDPVKQYSMGDLRDMYAPELEKFLQAAKGVQNDRFVTGDMLAINIDIVNEFFSTFKTVPQINGVGRSAAVNKAVGGVEGSDHLTGRATDWKTVGVPAPQKAELLRILESKGLGLVTHIHGQGPHFHASMDRTATPVERANLRVTQNLPTQYALTNNSGAVVGGKTIALSAPTKPVVAPTDIAFVAPDLPSMMTTNIQYTPTGEPAWPLPTPQVTVSFAESLEPVPVPSVTRGQDLAEATTNLEPSPIPNVVRGPELASVPEPLAANPTPRVATGPELGQPNPTGPVTRGLRLEQPSPAGAVESGPDLAPAKPAEVAQQPTLTSQPTPVARPPANKPLDTSAQEAQQTRTEKFFSRIASADPKLMWQTIQKGTSYATQWANEKIFGVAPTKSVGTLSTTPYQKPVPNGAEARYVCSGSGACERNNAQGLFVSTKPENSYVRVEIGGTTSVDPKPVREALRQNGVQPVMDAAGPFITTVKTGGAAKSIVDVAYNRGVSVGTNAKVNGRDGLVITNDKGNVMVANKRDLRVGDFAKLGIDVPAAETETRLNIVGSEADFATFDKIMSDNKLSAMTNLLLIDNGVFKQALNDAYTSRRFFVEMQDGSTGILTSVENARTNDFAKVAEAMGVKNAVNLDTGIYDEATLQLQDGTAVELGAMGDENAALGRIFVGVKDPSAGLAGPRTDNTLGGQPNPISPQPLRVPETPAPAPIESLGVNTRRPEFEPSARPQTTASNDNMPKPNTPTEVPAAVNDPVALQGSELAPTPLTRSQLKELFDGVSTLNDRLANAVVADPNATKAELKNIIDQVGQEFPILKTESPILKTDRLSLAEKAVDAYVEGQKRVTQFAETFPLPADAFFNVFGADPLGNVFFEIKPGSIEFTIDPSTNQWFDQASGNTSIGQAFQPGKGEKFFLGQTTKVDFPVTTYLEGNETLHHETQHVLYAYAREAERSIFNELELQNRIKVDTASKRINAALEAGEITSAEAFKDPQQRMLADQAATISAYKNADAKIRDELLATISDDYLGPLDADLLREVDAMIRDGYFPLYKKDFTRPYRGAELDAAVDKYFQPIADTALNDGLKAIDTLTQKGYSKREIAQMLSPLVSTKEWRVAAALKDSKAPTQFAAPAPMPAPLPFSPISSFRALAYVAPSAVPISASTQGYLQVQEAAWPTIAQAPTLVLEGEILPPAPVARSGSEVGQPKPDLELQANGADSLTQTQIKGLEAPRTQAALDGEILPPARVARSETQVDQQRPVLDLRANNSGAIAPTRYLYSGTNALGQSQVVIGMTVSGDKALVSLRSADGATIPSVEEIELLLRQLVARHPEVNTISSAPTTAQQGLTVVRPTVNVIPALENILITGPTMYVNSRGEVWPTLASAETDARMRAIVAQMQAEAIIDNGIRDIVAGITPEASTAQPVRNAGSVPSVPAPRLAEARTASPADVLDDAIRQMARDNVAQARATGRPVVPEVVVPQTRPTLAQVTPPPLPPESNTTTTWQKVKNVASDAMLGLRIARGVVLPAKTVKGNIAVNSMNMIAMYSLTGPYTVLTWPAANVLYRYTFNSDYRSDVNSVYGRVKVALEKSAAERAAFNAKQDLLNPNSLSSVPTVAVSRGTPSVARVEPRFADNTARDISIEEGIRDLLTQFERAPAPAVSIEDGIRGIVADIKAAGPSPETIIDQGMTDSAADINASRPVIRSYDMPAGSPIRTLTVVPLSKIDDLIAPKTSGTMRIYRGLGEAYDPAFKGPDPYFSPDYVDALGYAMQNTKPGQEPHLLIAEINMGALNDMYAYRQVQGVLKERFVGFGEVTSGYIQVPKNWFDAATFDAKFPQDIAGLHDAIKARQAEVPDDIAIMNRTNDRRTAIAVKVIEDGTVHWADLTTAEQDRILNADPEYAALREQFKNASNARDNALKEVAQEFRAQNPLSIELPKDPTVEGVPPPRASATDRLTETVQEFAADRPVVEKWGPFSNLREWFRNLGGGSGNGGNGGGGNGTGGEVGPEAGNSGNGNSRIRDGLISLARLVPGVASLINNAPQPDEKEEPADASVKPGAKPATEMPKPDSVKAKDAPKPAETKKPDTTTTTVPTPKTTTTPPPKAVTPPPAGPAPRPETTGPAGGETKPGSAPTGGTNSGGGAMNSLMSFLSGLMKGMSGAQATQPQTQQPTPSGQVTVAMYTRPNPAASGQDVIVSWTSINASTCSAFNASSTKVASGAPGSMFTVNVTAPTSFKVYCSNSMGQYASATVQILMQ